MKRDRADSEFDDIVQAIAVAAHKAFSELFENRERFYYCTLLTTGEGFPPIISAWSIEALEREAHLHTTRSSVVPMGEKRCVDNGLIWSYADSPYYAFGYEEHFGGLIDLYAHRALSVFDLGETEGDKEYYFRLGAMRAAMVQLDREGLFSLNQARNEVCLEVGTMPPDDWTIQTTLSLNAPSAHIMKLYEVGNCIS